MPKTILTGLLLVLTLTACYSPPAPAAIPRGEGLPVAPVFRDYYEAHGGLRILGDAISSELVVDGVRVQYFQNGRLEHHGQLPPSHQVVLSNLGERLYGLAPCVAADGVPSGSLYFAATCHSVSPEFRPFFEQYGGLSFFGYPISEMYIFDGRFVQHFERATIVWDGGKAPGLQFGLAGLGSLVCAAECSESLRGTNYAPAPSTPTPVPAEADLITRFYQRYGAARVFGLALTERRVGRDGAPEQVFENAILYEEVGAPEGVRLRQLGLRTGQIEPPAPQLDDPNSIYYARYGHNVAYGIYQFYRSFGGQDVFGQPITEMRVESNQLVQYFENVAVTWQVGLPPGQAAQLMSLGRQALAAEQAQAAPAPRSAPPQMLWVSTEAAYRLLEPASQQQTLRAQVLDENGLPVAGATLTFTVGTPDGEVVYVIDATDAEGRAAVSFAVKSYISGGFMMYSAQAEYAGLRAAKSDSFVTWAKPGP